MGTKARGKQLQASKALIILKKYLALTTTSVGITIALIQGLVDLKSPQIQEDFYNGSIYTYFTRDLGRPF